MHSGTLGFDAETRSLLALAILGLMALATTVVWVAVFMFLKPARGDTIEPRLLYIIDGDTLALARERIRLLGIDAPGTRDARCGASRRLHEQHVAYVDDRAVLEGDNLDGCSGAGIHLPVRGINLDEARTRAIADKLQDISWSGAVAGEVDNRVAIRLPTPEYEGIVAAAALQHVRPGAAHNRVAECRSDGVLDRRRVSLLMPSA